VIAPALLALLLGQAEVTASAPLTVGAYFRTGGAAYLSRAQTAGGLGGGAGARLTFDDRYLLQADLSGLFLLGTSGLLRVSLGLQRQGTWSPALLAQGSVFLGERLRFSAPARPAGVQAPAMALGVALAPLRWVTSAAEVSLLEVGYGFGWDFPGPGAALQLTVLELGRRF
jgi:hypothetical protein